MNIKYIIGSTFLSLLALMSCNDDERNVETKGYLELGVTKNVEVITRGFDVDDQSLAVDICVGANDSVAKHFDDYNSMAGERVLLDVGTYKVRVSSNPIQKLDFEMPTFYGEEKNVAVTAGKTTPVSVECFLSCVKITTEFTKPVKEKFASCVARISDKSGAYLDYSMTETRAGYFQPDYIMVDLTVENKEGLTFKMSKLIENTEARDHYHLIFDLVESGDNNSGMDFNISIETDPTNDEKHNVTIPLPETGYGQGAPEINILGIEDKGTLTIKQTEIGQEQYNVTVNAKSENIGIQKVQLLVQTTSELFESIPSILTVSDLTQEDPEYKILSDLGFVFPLDYSDEKAEYVYSFTPKGLLPGDYKFTLWVYDKNGGISSCEFTYKIMSEISTEVINGNAAYVWSRFAYLRGYAANPSLGGSFKYKKSSETEWSMITEGVSFDEDGFATAKATGLESGEVYDYMFMQGDVESEMKTFTTDSETEVPNLNFDSWSDDYTPSGWWSSGNEGTSMLKLYPTLKDNGTSGNGVKMYTSYYSGKVLGFYQVDKLVAGNLFLGSYQGLSGVEGVKLDFGHEYTSRPSKLKFQYKYTSEKINVINNNRGSASNDNDEGFIYFLLTDKMYNIDTTNESTFIKEDSYASDEHILAYGSFTISQTVSDFEEGTIKLTYKTLEKKPTYIIIVASSSKKGDYFTGGEGSTLWLDEFELVYDDDFITAE